MASNNLQYFHNHNQKNHNIVVVVVPFPAQGHLNQLLQLCRLIASYNIQVHYVTTITHTLQAKHRVHGWDTYSKIVKNIHFHEFPTPFFTSPSPNPNASIKFPCHLQPAFESTLHLRRPLANLLGLLSTKNRRVVVIHDSLMGSVVQDFVYLPNAEAYTFHSVSAFTLFLFMWENMGRPFDIDQDLLKDVPSLEGCFSPEFEKFIKREYDYMKFNSGRIYNTCRVMEGHFLELLSKFEQINDNKKQWALGPFNPVLLNGAKVSGRFNKRHNALLWLDKQESNSVIFVSFGTTTSFSDEQIKEIAIGLEQSKQKFIWVLRDADKGNVFAKESRKIDLPKGFEERVQEKGILLRDWAPQLEILAHSSVGGFMSHCGWNSCMESISMGVPIAAWPMHSDQPRNTILITKILKVGLVVRDWTRGHEVVTRVTVQAAVEKLMASEEGEEMRDRAIDLSAALKKSVAEGGVKHMELDSFISHITRQI